jgi:hypothetical protein
MAHLRARRLEVEGRRVRSRSYSTYKSLVAFGPLVSCLARTRPPHGNTIQELTRRLPLVQGAI